MTNHPMANASCSECDRLLELYRGSVRLYREAVEDLSGTINDDFVRVMEKAQRFWTACQFAGDALTAHHIHDHGNDPGMTRMSPRAD